MPTGDIEAQEQETLYESAKSLTAAMGLAVVGLWDWKPHQNVLFFDDCYYTMAGYTPGEFPPTFAEWEARVHPDDLEPVVRELKRLAKGEVNTSTSQIRFRTKSGDWIWILGRASVIQRDASGLPARIIGTHTDISDLVKSRADLQKHRTNSKRLMDEAHSGIFIAQDGRFIYVNPSMERISGYCLEELSGMMISDLLHPDDIEIVMDRHTRRLRGESITNFYTLRGIKKDGQEIWLDINATLSEWEDRPAVIGFLRDVTYSKILEHQLLQAQKMQAIGTLAGGIAHDFNNILSAMIGYTEICMSEISADSRAMQRLERVLQAGQRARELINQILTFSRQEKIDQKPVNVALLVKESMKFLKASIPSTITIESQIDKDAGVVLADPTSIHQIIMNLCTNAVHAMQERGGVLNVSLSNIDVDHESLSSQIRGIVPGAYVRLLVADTGHGMAPQMIKRVFEPYFTTKKQGEGTGLGLSVVHGIVTQLGGVVTVYSEPDKGTIFHVYLPRLLSSEETAVATDRALLVGGHETILLVEDEVILLEMTCEMLESLGYKVVCRTNGMEAYEAYAANPDQFDLLITDQMMPSMTGVELSERIKKGNGAVPIILCSGFSTRIALAKKDFGGIRAILKKPILKQELAEAIRRVLAET